MPPQVNGPGTFCGHTFGLTIGAPEMVRVMWPGEIFINDVYGTYYVTTAGGDVVVTEDGARTRPGGRSRSFTVGRTRFRAFGDRRYSVAVAGNASIKAVTIRFPEGTSDSSARAFLGRVRLGAAAGTQCLRPQNS